MPEFKLIEKLLYKSEQNDIETEFLIGKKHYEQVKKLYPRFLEPVLKIYQSIS